MRKYALFAVIGLGAIPIPCIPGIELFAADQTKNGNAVLKEMQLILHRSIRSVLPAEPAAISALHAESGKYAASLQPDGTWSDIDYTGLLEARWSNGGHLQRTLVMAKSARLYRDSKHPDPSLDAKVILALKSWTDHDYRNYNWWWNEIGVPELTGEIVALSGPLVPAHVRTKVVQVMKRSNWSRAPWTGANLIWGATIEVVRGCLEGDPASVSEGYRRMYEEIKIVPPDAEGVLPDGSFHQHGAQLYNGGYGLVYANDVGRFVSYARGTRFEIPPERLAIFSSYILDGEQWMIRGDVFDYSTIGREITRQGKVAVSHDWTGGPISPAGAAYGLGNVIQMLAQHPNPRKKEFQAFAARLQEKANAPELTGNKQFWWSDFMVHRRKAFYTSVKMLSKRIVNGENIDGEGTRSHHLSDGVNLLYLTGDEYKDLFPVWDWNKLPGATAVQEAAGKKPVAVRGGSTFTGGASDGTYGLSAMDAARDNLSARKAWFFFDDSYVCLGAGIALANDVEHDVSTGVNQCHLAGNVFTSDSQIPFPGGTRTYTTRKTAWVYHNHVGYIFPSGTRVSLSAASQTGKWSEIGRGSSEPVTLPVFSLSIDHGRAPQHGSYQYIVLPGVTADQVSARAVNPRVNVLSNKDDLQAVYHDELKLVEAAFRKAGTLRTPLGRIEVDHACLLMLRQDAKGWKITASNPENEPLTLNVKAGGKPVAIQLPAGNLAGSSVTVRVSGQLQ